MKRMFNECLLTWRSAVTSGGEPVWRPVELALLGGLGVLCLGLLIFVHAPFALIVGAPPLLSVTILLLMLWARFIGGAIRLNSPANAALVPRLNRRIRQSAALAWAVTVLPFVLATPWVNHGAMMLFIVGASLLLLAAMLGGRPLTAIAGFLGGDLGLVSGGEPSWRLTALPAVQGMMLLMVALLGWAVLRMVWPTGGERHWKRYGHLLSLGPAASRERTAQFQRGGRWRPVYRRLLARDIRLGQPRHLLLHVFGPGAHRLDLLLILAQMLTACILGRLAYRYWPQSPLFEQQKLMMWALIGWLMFVPFSPVVRWKARMNASRSEQALVRLAPRAPAAARLNRTLAGQLLRISISDYLVGSSIVFGVAVVVHASSHMLLCLLAYMAAALPLLGFPLRDHAANAPALTWPDAAQLALTTILAVAALALAARPLLWATLMVALIVVSYFIVAARWRTMLASPAAFPAGRMG